MRPRGPASQYHHTTKEERTPCSAPLLIVISICYEFTGSFELTKMLQICNKSGLFDLDVCKSIISANPWRLKPDEVSIGLSFPLATWYGTVELHLGTFCSR